MQAHFHFRNSSTRTRCSFRSHFCEGFDDSMTSSHATAQTATRKYVKYEADNAHLYCHVSRISLAEKDEVEKIDHDCDCHVHPPGANIILFSRANHGIHFSVESSSDGHSSTCKKYWPRSCEEESVIVECN